MKFKDKHIYCDLDNTIFQTTSILAKHYGFRLSPPIWRPLDESKYNNNNLFKKHLDIIVNTNIIDFVLKEYFNTDTYETKLYDYLYNIVINQRVLWTLYKVYKQTNYPIIFITAKKIETDNTKKFLEDVLRYKFVMSNPECILYDRVGYIDRVYAIYHKQKLIMFDDYGDLRKFVRNKNILYQVCYDDNLEFSHVDVI